MEKKYFPESELIINSDGSCFHLHLTPDHLADKVILVGDPGRVATVAAHFDSIENEVASREFHTITGTYKGKRITVQSTGIGCDNIDIVMNELDALANIDFATRRVRPEHRTLNIVRIGTSGALQEDLNLGDYVIAEKGIGIEGILNFYADRDWVCDLEFEKAFCHHVGWRNSLATPYVVDADPELVEHIGRDDMVRGFTIAAVGFYAPQGRQLRLPLADPDLNAKIESFEFNGRHITNFEMESACLQGMARLLDHKAMTVCCIIAQRRSNKANTDYKPRIKELIKTVLDRL